VLDYRQKGTGFGSRLDLKNWWTKVTELLHVRKLRFVGFGLMLLHCSLETQASLQFSYKLNSTLLQNDMRLYYSQAANCFVRVTCLFFLFCSITVMDDSSRQVHE
jgi:hypothetical protein